MSDLPHKRGDALCASVRKIGKSGAMPNLRQEERDSSIAMHDNCLRPAAISVRRLCLRRHCEGLIPTCHLPCRMGNARSGPALINMLVQAGRVLCHGGCHQEWRDKRYYEDVFHKFSPAFFNGARCVPSFQPRLRSLDVALCHQQSNFKCNNAWHDAL